MRKLIPIVLAMMLIGALAIGTTAAPAAKSAKVKVNNNFFDPKNKTVKKGTKVKFKWAGGVPHNVNKKKGPGGKFKSKTTSASGVQFRKKFKKRGTYKLICTIHRDSMKMKLTVR